MRVLPNWSENSLLWLEAISVFLFGFGVIWLSHPLGCYLILAGMSQAVWRGVASVYAINKTMDMHDAALEQQVSAERFREVQGR